MADAAAEEAKQRTRRMIAIVMIGLGTAGIAVIAGLAIGYASAQDRADTTTMVFTALLPLFGTWVGTVLAFYFTADNLEAATQSTLSTLRLAGTLSDETPVRDVMIPASVMLTIEPAAGQSPGTIKLHDALTKMNDNGFHRIPIIGASGEALYVVHDSVIHQFASSLSKDPGNAAVFTETLTDLLAVPDLKRLVEAIAFVGEDANLGSARAAMAAVDGSNDVFVTATGQQAERVVGWLTNTKMAELA